MSLGLIVVLCALGAAVIAFALSASRHVDVDPIDPAAEERAVVRFLGRHPRLRRFVRQRLDRETAGGLLLTISFGIVFLVALVVGVVLDMIDEGSGLAAFDDEVAEWGSEHASSGAIDVLEAITQLGSTTVVVVALAAVAAYDYGRRRNLEVVVFVAVVGGGQLLLVNGLKALVERERPAVLHLTEFSGWSFPSGHSAAAAAAWSAVALVLSRGQPRLVRAALGAGAVLIAVAVAASRALLGVHWLTDVVAGSVFGWGWFLVVAIAFGGRAQRLGDPAAQRPSVDGTPSDRAGLTPAERTPSATSGRR